MTDVLKKTIIDEFGLNELSEEKKNEVLVKVAEIILKRVTIAVMEMLSPEDQDEFEKLITGETDETKKEEVILNFFQTKVPNLDAIIAQETEDFRKESAELMGGLE